jgi:hypothetical protein
MLEELIACLSATAALEVAKPEVEAGFVSHDE